jgi:MinD superfamily P-loop ATPase
MQVNKKIKIVISSGKGGVGKSMLTSCLAVNLKEFYNIIALDCDVDAPNLAVWLNETDNWDNVEKISTSFKPYFDIKKCDGCGLCAEICRFDALKMVNNKPVLRSFLCEGCGACEVLCPKHAIYLKPVKNGEIKIKKTRFGFYLISGRLYPGETGSGKIVDELKNKAEKFKYDIMIIDSSPGTGCPVIAAFKGSGFVVFITEPTPSGLSDLMRVIELVKHFKIPWGLVINKWDINKKLSFEIRKSFENKFLGFISYDKSIFRSISNFKPIFETQLKANSEIMNISKKIRSIINSLFKK